MCVSLGCMLSLLMMRGLEGEFVGEVMMGKGRAGGSGEDVEGEDKEG